MTREFFRFAYVNLARNKILTALNIAGLAIGVFVCLLIGVWLKRELSYDDFHPKGKRIFRVVNTFTSESESFSQAPSGPALGSQLPKQLPILKAGCRLFSSSNKFKVGDDYFVESKGLVVDSNFFDFFGFRLLKGDAERVLSSPDQVVLTERMAKKYFGNDNPVGKTILTDDRETATVSGIAADPPSNSHIEFDYLVPFSQLRDRARRQWNADLDNIWSGGWPFTYVQLGEGVDPAEAERRINETVQHFARQEWKENKMSYAYHLQPVRDIHLHSNLRYDTNNGSQARVEIFSIVGFIVLLLACINYVNLTTAGAVRRAKETSVRKVVGASRFALVRQFFIETMLLCAIAVLFGVAILKLVLPAFNAWLGQSYRFDLDPGVWLLLAGFMIFLSLITGIYPAVVLSSFTPATALKGNFSRSPRGKLLRKGLVVFQFTITIGLLASLLIIQRQMNYVRNKSLGFDATAVLEVDFRGDASVSQHYAAIRQELMNSPYILNVSKHGQNVVGGLGNGWTTTENLEGKEISTSLYMLSVDTSYFKVYDMKLAAGRFFSHEIPTDTISASLVNEAAVRTFGWKTPEKAIGKRFGKGKDARYVVGVVKDFNFESLHKPVEALQIVYWPIGSRLSLKIDSRHIEEAINHLKKTWTSMAPSVPLQYSFVNEQIEKQYANEQKMQTVFYGFGIISLLIACIGLFGLTLFIVESRIKEIGVRKVLGAGFPGIVMLLSKDFLKLVVIAAVVASPIAWYLMSYWLEAFAYRVNIAWWLFALSGGIALAVALVTIGFKAIRAALTNPVQSLRVD
jgi:putative ABC transport system permease protein